jgi:hypothetical protein
VSATGRFLLQNPAVWRFLYCLTLISFVLRALVPAGFMPDAAAFHDGRPALKLCTSIGTRHASAHAAGHASAHDLADASRHDPGHASAPHQGDEAPAGSDCPFGLLLVQAVVPSIETAVLLAAAPVRDVAVRFHAVLAPLLPIPGPPLGPRAPPVNL